MSHRRARRLAFLLVAALSAAAGSGARAADAATAAPRTPARQDPHHRLTARIEFYSSASRAAKEQGVCRVALFADADGRIRAVQLLDSTGYPELDASCIRSLEKDRVIPATMDGRPVPGWLDASIDWQFSSGSLIPTSVRNKWSVPRLPPDYRLRVGPEFFPPESRERKEQGTCLVLAHIDATGALGRVEIAKSTGFPALDRACLDAVTGAPFAPAQIDGRNQDGVAAITLYWRLH